MADAAPVAGPAGRPPRSATSSVHPSARPVPFHFMTIDTPLPPALWKIHVLLRQLMSVARHLPCRRWWQMHHVNKAIINYVTSIVREGTWFKMIRS